MGKISFFVVLAAISACGWVTNAFAMDHRSQYGVGGALGGNFVAPWSHEDLRNKVSAQFPAASVWGRYIVGTPEIGLELSYNYIALGTMDFSAHTGVLSFISRQNPWGNFHPFYGLGVGYARTSNKFATGDLGVWDDPIFKLTAGIEFERNERFDIGLRIDHYTIFRDLNTQHTMNIITPMVTLNYYFGHPAPMPTAATPPPPTPEAPKPSVTAPATPAVKEAPHPVARPAKPHVTKPAPKAKAKTQPPKGKKKAPKTKKRKVTPPEPGADTQ